MNIKPGNFNRASFAPETDEQCFWCSSQAAYIVAYGCTQLHIHGLAACHNCWNNLQPQWAHAKCPDCDCAIWDWGLADRQGNTQTSWQTNETSAAATKNAPHSRTNARNTVYGPTASLRENSENSPMRSPGNWQAPRCDWNNIGKEQCLHEADIAVAGICANKHVELYAYCNKHHEYWLTFTEPPMHWICRTCGQLITEHMSQPYEL